MTILPHPFVPSEVEGHDPGHSDGVSTSLDTNGLFQEVIA